MKYAGYFIYAAFVFWVTVFLASVASAQAAPKAEAEACKIPDGLIDVRPDPGSKPTVISVGLRMIDLTEINDVKRTLTGRRERE